ncbi:peptidylprolyl isomerase [Blattabacterium cuenoti]|uniref:peptidylprolyl isomerase n=1 Tax=Blattabacterium cuenoti TaxID=1653831 RepID=UPI00163BE465|nr:peptidylprolyl isomerase [Blattabacterium cuenoti]
MSFLEKIRKNTWLIFLFISIFLIFFILDPSILLKCFSKNSNIIGKVNNDHISLKEYIESFQFLKKFRESEPDYLLKNDVWKLLVHEKVLNQQAIKLGIKSTKKDFWKAIKKQSIYSHITDFQDIKGDMDIEKFKLYLKKLNKKYVNKTPEIKEEKNMWLYEKNNIKKRIIAKKYIEMLMYGLNTSLIEAKLNQINKNLFSIIDYVFIPYSEIEKKYNIYPIKNIDIFNWINKNKFLYKKINLRNLSFIIFNSSPSLDDEKKMNNKIKKLFKEFKNSNDHDSIIVSNQSEKPFDYNFYLKKQLPPILQFFVEKNNKIGSMFGPIKDNNIYVIGKLTRKKKLFDSVLSSHILISHKEAIHSFNKRTKKEAEKIAKNLYNFVKKNPDQFNYLVKKKSDDFINAKKNNGSLGWIKYEGKNLIGSFDIFSSENKKGKIGLTETKFGYHIIRIDEKKNPKIAYQFAMIIKTLIPSKKTKNIFHEKVMSFFKNNKNSNLNTLINNARKNKYETIFLEEVKNNQSIINGLNTELDKKIINWSFEKNRKIGDTNIFHTSNKDYIMVYLSKIQKNGIPIEKIKNEIIPLIVDNKINKILSNSFFKKSLEEIAFYFSKKINKYCKINFYNLMIDDKKEPKVVGSAFSSNLYKTSKPILGKKGIFFIKPLKRFSIYKKPDSISSEIESLNTLLRKNTLEKLGDVLIEKSVIKDYRKNI